MYKIIGTDQKEYGPISAGQIRQWIAEGRVNAQTKVRAGDGTDWKPLADFPEFAEAPKTRMSPPPLDPPAAAPAKTSGLAIASLVLGIAGLFTCGITALVGLILGIIALVKIPKSGGQSKGSGIALAGTIVSAIFLLVIPLAILPAMLLPALAKAKQKAQTIQCLNNSRQLVLAIHIYADGNTNQLPPVVTWCDAIQHEVGSEKIFKCPAADVTERCTYAFNSKLDGAHLDKLDPSTVVIFETGGGWNLSGGRELLPDHSRHTGKFIVGFADGHAEVVPESRISTLRWDP